MTEPSCLITPYPLAKCPPLTTPLCALSMYQSTEIQGPHAVQIWQHWMLTLYGLDSDVYGDQHFSARLSTLETGRISLTKIESSRHRVRRTSAAVNSRRTDFFKIVAPWKGSAIIHQYERSAQAHPGQWIIYDTTQEYALEAPEWCEHLVVTLPKIFFSSNLRVFDALMGSYVGGGPGASRVALDLMRSCFAECPSMPEALARHVVDQMAQMIQLSLLDACNRTASLSPAELLKSRIKAHVRQHVRNPALSIEGIAEALHCSKRHLYNAFADEPASISQFIWQERLSLFRRELQQPGLRHCTLTEIALACGFANGAHLSRLFKQQMGITPVQYRSGLTYTHS